MKIPEFQPDPLRQSASESAAAIRPHRETVRGAEGGFAAFTDTAPATTRSAERIQAADAVEFSPLSLTILGRSNLDAQVEALESAYRQGHYSVDADALAHTLVQTLLWERGHLEST